jgi:nicotinamide riboside transporter PnuC
MNNYWGWIGTVTGIAGGLLIAFKFEHSKFGYIFFMLSAISWIIQGIKNNDKSLVLLNSVFVIVNTLGLYHWFI